MHEPKLSKPSLNGQRWRRLRFALEDLVGGTVNAALILLFIAWEIFDRLIGRRPPRWDT